jgi:hypothetical protein
MVVSRHLEASDLAVVTLRGVFTGYDQAELLEWFRASIRTAFGVRLLIVLESYGGWKPGEQPYGQSSWLRDDEGVIQIAIVGSTAWRMDVLTLLAAPLRGIPIKYFESEAAARRWLGVTPVSLRTSPQGESL